MAINSAPTEGVKVVPLSQVRATFPVLKNPANRHRAVGLHARAVALRLHQHLQRGGVAARCTSATTSRRPAAIFWGSALANIHPGHDDNWVDYHNADRAPLLFISGSEDHLMPPKIQQSNAKHYKADGHHHRGQGVRGPAPAARPGRLGGDRRLRARLGGRATPTRATAPAIAAGDDVHSAHPHRRADGLIEVGGWRLLTDPTFDAPGRTYKFGWGTSSRKVTGRRSPSPTSGRSTRCCSPTITTPTTSTTPAGRCCPSADVVVTTASGAQRLGGDARGLEPWADDAARGARPAADRDHGDAVPPRPAAAASRSSAT